jgi:glycosyltransferase involved in cell wall biosynthesis
VSALLSILIPTVAGREHKLARLMRGLEPQLRLDVEVLIFPDARSMSIGEKRNRLVDLASGDYIAFVDDDDQVTDDYVSSITSMLAQRRPDVLCFSVLVFGHGQPKICRYHPSFTHADLPREYKRKPNHIMPWRRQLAERVRFPSVSFGEDTQWAESMSHLAKSVCTINRHLYKYLYDPKDNSAIRVKR